MKKEREFMSREKFDSLKSAGEIKRCSLFPILDYDMCKYVREHSPLISSLLDEAEKIETK